MISAGNSDFKLTDGEKYGADVFFAVRQRIAIRSREPRTRDFSIAFPVI